MVFRSLFALCALLPFVALAQGADDRIERMERRLMAIENRVFSQSAGGDNAATSGPSLTALADFEVRLSQLEEETRRVYGGVEELSHAVSQLAQKLELIAEDLNLRLQDLETGKAAVAPAAANQSEKVSTNQPAPQQQAVPLKEDAAQTTPTENAGISAAQHYQKAYNYLSTASYDQAEEWFTSFLEQHSQHEMAENAYYWLGEVHLVKNQPEKAVISFSNGLKAFPESSRVPVQLLKMGSAFERLGRVDHARSSWEKLLRDFPDSAEAGKARQLLADLKS